MKLLPGKGTQTFGAGARIVRKGNIMSAFITHLQTARTRPILPLLALSFILVVGPLMSCGDNANSESSIRKTSTPEAPPKSDLKNSKPSQKHKIVSYRLNDPVNV